MKNKEYDDYFLDVTFKIIPKKFRPNKLLTIATVDKINNKTILIAFIIFKYMDIESYYRIFKYLNENYGFSPKYIHTDYEIALEQAIKKSEFFDKNLLHIKCFFHFVKSLREKLKKIKSNKKGLNEETINILNNLELISFINYDKVNDLKKFIIYNLKKKNKYKDFIKYLNLYWFKRNINDYNYSKFINKFKNNNDAINKLYFTNNIVESIHAKINYFLPRHIETEFDFITCLNNVLLNNYINNSSIIRKDYKSRSLLYLIEKEEINNNFKWLDNSVFKSYLEAYLKEKLNNSERDNMDQLI